MAGFCQGHKTPTTSCSAHGTQADCISQQSAKTTDLEAQYSLGSLPPYQLHRGHANEQPARAHALTLPVDLMQPICVFHPLFNLQSEQPLMILSTQASFMCRAADTLALRHGALCTDGCAIRYQLLCFRLLCAGLREVIVQSFTLCGPTLLCFRLT